MDGETTREEIVRALSEQLSVQIEDSHIKSLRPAHHGCQRAILCVPSAVAEIILKVGNLKIGFTVCRIRKNTSAVRCYRCLTFGQRAPQRGLFRSSLWSVGEIYTASDHEAILFTIGVTKPRQAALPQSRVYKSDTLDVRAFAEALATHEWTQSTAQRMADQLYSLLAASCNASMAPRGAVTRKQGSDTADQDPWGRAYKIVVKRFYANRFSSPTEASELERIVCDLFPQRAGSLNCRRVDHVASRYHVPVTNDEVLAAARSLKQNKAPGPDSIPTSAGNGNSPRNIRGNLRPVAEGGSIPISVEVAKAGAAPQAWETSRGSVVISSNLPRGLSANQYGFRKARSTIDAVSRVQRLMLLRVLDGKEVRRNTA
ncbi:uncharacterized protein [Drosophila tropicalis]|uniref:uncharacterized protein n=1 Tax=Drosophila tropicalis TaxID=46794 RepID=UPI0035AB81E0